MLKLLVLQGASLLGIALAFLSLDTSLECTIVKPGPSPHPSQFVLQVIVRDAPIPELPAGVPVELAQLHRVMPPDQHRMFVFNKTMQNERICLGCRTHYRWDIMAMPLTPNFLA